MSTAAASFHRIVVEDVIKSIREDFINEGVDEQVLEDLKQLWENKLLAAGVYDYPNQAPVGYAYDLNTYNYLDTTHAAPSTMLPSLPPSLHNMNSYLTSAPRTGGAAHMQALNNLRALNPPSTSTHPTTTTSNYPYDSYGKPQQYLPPPTGATNWNTQPNSNTLPAINTQYNPPPPTNIKQHDGANDEVDPAQERKRIDALLLKKYARAQKLKQQIAKLTAKSDLSTSTTSSDSSIPQFDGLGDRRKAKEEEEEEDDESDESEKGGGAGDEELGSDLDDDDDEEEPDTDNIVLCQYEKVTRVKNKRKANLKDGIMHINGKDYVFSKATGEFEW